ncbi:MAG TPA: NAD(P)H-dependent oxidoreductase [Lacisediminihabitans sp.]|uniref:NADPH-dependent FMN reductase n=1 Tax=Lacisediminihabitans sp. TaxID=2787631 RepID=UPI002ED81197
MPQLMIVVGSVRPGRIGLPIARWVESAALAHGAFEIDVVDLAELDLPFMDEPNHPRLRSYTQQHTIDWSARVDAADAIVFVTPEYNHSFSPALKNAIDYLHTEWSHKPAGFVSYGGVSAGTRGVIALQPALVGLGVVLSQPNVEINFPGKQLNDDGEFEPTEQQASVAAALLTELAALAGVLKPLQG